MITTYGNEYSLMRCDDVKNMKEKSTEDKEKELDEACRNLRSYFKCILKDDSCSDDEFGTFDHNDDIRKTYERLINRSENEADEEEFDVGKSAFFGNENEDDNNWM